MSKKNKEDNKKKATKEMQSEDDNSINEAAVEVQEMISEEDKLKEELAKEKDKFLRLFAEFENFKKRTAKERIELFKTANQDVVVAMLPVLDDFDRALNEIAKSNDNELLKGVELISNKFKEALKSKGLDDVEVNQGVVFDADVHEAITQIPAPSEELKGKIVDVIEKGYKLGEKIIRYPKVVVGQ